jgi:uncharacterized protein DUF3486
MVKRRSRIAKLPREVRNQVNVMLDEGATYQSVVDWLHGKGYPECTVDMVFQWKKGGFQDWLRDERRADSERSLRDWATSVAADTGQTSLPTAYVMFASAQLRRLVDDIDEMAAKASLKEHPEEYARLFNSLARFAKLAVEMEKVEKIIRLRKELQAKGAEEGKAKRAPKTDELAEITGIRLP